VAYQVKMEEREPQPIVVVRRQVAPAGLPSLFGPALGKIMSVLPRHGVNPVGPPPPEAWAAESGLQATGPCWESYLSDPTTVAPADLQTQVYWQVA